MPDDPPKSRLVVGEQQLEAAAASTNAAPEATPPPEQPTPTPFLGAQLVVTVAGYAYYSHSAPDITLVDSGELILAAAGPGVAHPAGFPAWTLLSHAAMKLLPAVDPIRAANLVSVACAVLAMLCFYELARGICRPRTSYEEVGPLAGALLATFAFPIWGTATFSEVYSLTSAALLGALALTQRWRDGRRAERSAELMGAGCLFGLAFSAHHISAALVLPALCWLAAAGARSIREAVWSLALPALCSLPVAAGFYGSIFAIATQKPSPLMNWGGVKDVQTLLWHVSGKMYSVNLKWPRYTSICCQSLLAIAAVHPAVILASTTWSSRRSGR